MGQNVEAPAVAGAPLAALKFAWGVAATVMAVLYTAVCAPIAAAVAPFAHGDYTNWVGRLWARLIIWTSGVTVELEGLENIAALNGFVLVTNHQSAFDIFAVIAYMPRQVRFLAKKELLRIPFFGYAMRRSGHIVVDRQRGGPTVRQAVDLGGRGYCICVFAEGHRFDDNQVHPFQQGAAWLAIQAKLPCVPMAISGSGAFFPRGAKVVVPGGRMRLSLGPPIATADLRSNDRAALTEHLEAAVRAMFLPVV
ncbi:MAG: lysophospholipid acyltransferase family protein [Candidatus Binataceae bacterium]|jgi:1-acyl-sn-glycerol-3-phosphate acyltransferase